MPAARELDGDFSQTFHRRTIYNPYTTRTENGRLVRDPFPGNVIPANLISPSMQSFLKAYMPKPTLPGNVADNFRQFRDQESDSNAFQVRVDHHFSARDNLFFRWTERRINNWIPVGDLGFRTPDAINRNYGGGLFHVFGSNLVLEVRGGVATQPTEDAPFEHELGLGPQAGLPQLDRFGGYIVAGLNTPWTNLPNLGVQGPRERQNPNWNAAADMSWLRGSAQLQVRLPDAADLAPADEPVRADQLQRRSDARSAEHGRRPAIRLPRRCWDCRRASRASCRLTATSTSTRRRCRATCRISGRCGPNLTFTYGLRYDYVTRVLGELRIPERPGHEHRRMADRPRDRRRRCCSGQAPPCLPAPLPSIPFNQYIKITGERRLDPEADHRQLGTARRTGVAAHAAAWCCAAATRCCGIRWCRAASTASISTSRGDGRSSPASTPAP